MERSLAVAVALASFSAAAVPFSISGGSLVVGSSYGTGNGRLVAKITSFVSQNASNQLNFDLGLGQTQSFLFGRVTLNETCINGSNILIDVFMGCGIGSEETDNLGVTSLLNFTSPLTTSVTSTAAPVPEPEIVGLFGLSAFGLVYGARRKKVQKVQHIFEGRSSNEPASELKSPRKA